MPIYGVSGSLLANKYTLNSNTKKEQMKNISPKKRVINLSQITSGWKSESF